MISPQTSAVDELLSCLSEGELRELDALLQDAPASMLLDWLQDDPSRLLSQAGIQPDPWQSALLRSWHPEMLLLCSRQVGKSTVAAALTLREALFTPGALVLILAPTERQSKELLQDKVMRLYDALGAPVPAKRRQQTSLELCNGSRIIALPDNEAGVRCYSGVSLLVIDEASRVPDPLYFAVRPMLAVSQGRLIALSTPFGRRGWYFQEWSQGQAWHRVAIPATSCARLSPEFLRQERLKLGERWFSQEYLLNFVDAVDAVFSQDVIRAAMTDSVTPLFG